MSNLRMQKRLAAAVMRCGKRKVWMDPNETLELANATSRQNIRRLAKDGLIIRKPVCIHSNARVRWDKIARAKGRHSGLGKRKGTRQARTNPKTVWMNRMRVLRRLLKRYRDAKKIDKHLHLKLYLKVKGNSFKNKRVLMEYIFKKKTEMERLKLLTAQADAHRMKCREAKKRRLERIAAKKAAAS